MIKIEYSHSKSDMVSKSLRQGEVFTEAESRPKLLWLPLIMLFLLAIEYISYPLRGDVANFFPEQDSTYPFIFGLFFSALLIIGTLMLYFMRKAGLYLTIAVMACEWFYFGVFGLLKIQRFDFDGRIITYPMFGDGFIPGIDLIMPMYALIIRQSIILGSLIFLWKKFD